MLDNIKLPGEIFKDIEGFKDYAVSNKGRVYSHKSNKILAQQTANKFGAYPNEKYVRILRGKEYHNLYVPLIVANAFVPNPSGKRKVRHVDEDSTNNNSDNLEWVGYPRKYTEEWIRNRLGMKKFNYKIKNTKQAKGVVCTNYDIEFDSMTKAAEIIDVSMTSIKNACETGKDIHGLYFQFKLREEN